MISKDKLRSILLNIAKNNNIIGESANLLVDEITYALYHEQIEITNAIQESNLSTARLINSKIRNCMNVMYPVYRGKNTRVKLNFKNNTVIKKSKFDVLYNSNTFKVYAEGPIDMQISTPIDSEDHYTDFTIIGILATKDLYDSTIEVTEDTKYYIDFKIDQEVISNLSEDLQVFINGVEYQVTRNFFEFIQQDVPLQDYDAYEIEGTNGGQYLLNNNWTLFDYDSTDPDIIKQLNILGTKNSTSEFPTVGIQELDKLFILTIPDYGIRLHKRRYFNVSNQVRIRALKYTTADEINSDEFSKILIPGTELGKWVNGVFVVPDNEKLLLKKNQRNRISNTSDPNRNDSGIIIEIERDNEKSLLYNANYYERLQGQILSNSDINMLFNEYFVDIVKNSVNVYKKGNTGAEDYIQIYYVPKVAGDQIIDTAFDEFKRKFGSYFINDNLKQSTGILVTVSATINLYVNNNEELRTAIEAIYSGYEDRLNDPTQFTVGNQYTPNIFNSKKVWSDISKLGSVDYIDSIEYSSDMGGQEIGGNWYPPAYQEGTMIPTYYKFELNISYKSTNEVIS